MCLTINNLVQMTNETTKIKSDSNSPLQTYGTQLASLTLLHTPYGESKSPINNNTQRTSECKYSADLYLRPQYRLSTRQ